MFRVSHAVYIMSAPGTTLISAGGRGDPHPSSQTPAQGWPGQLAFLGTTVSALLC